MAEKQNRPISVNSDKVRYDTGHTDYSFQMRKPRRFPWWIFLLLLPLLLLIRCQKDIEVRCLEEETKAPVCFQEITLKYTDHSILSPSRKWFTADEIERTQLTDSTGVAVFEDLPCSVYSYIFRCLEKGYLSVFGECYAPANGEFNFHYTRHVDLVVAPRRETLRVRVVDEDTGDPLPDATVFYEYGDGGIHRVDSVHVDAAGVATLPDMRYCSKIQVLTGRCYGYLDGSRTDVPCRDMLVESDSTALRLKPVKEQFVFFVKNKQTKQPIPDAHCVVTLSYPQLNQNVVSRVVRTSIDGQGRGVYDEAPIISFIAIEASKPGFKDGHLEDGPNGPWKVEQFILQDEDTRTVWLEPEPFVQEFVNVDSLTLRPIPGVRNEITVTRPDGTSTTVVEVGNRNGVFPVSAAEDDVVVIVSVKNNEYVSKRTVYPRFRDIQDRKIRMYPEMVQLQFRTVMADDMQTLVPDCTLRVQGSISGSLPPNNSGNGVFTVNMRKAEKLSIVASKVGCKTNSRTVRNRDYAYLQANASRRAIPMELPPCNGGVQESYDGPARSVSSYNMGRKRGSASIKVDFYGVGDYLTVYDGLVASGMPIVSRRYIEHEAVIPFSFTQGAVTVVIESESGSSGIFEVRCP